MTHLSDNLTMPAERILVLNPGSTSTKMAVYEGDRERERETLVHGALSLSTFRGTWEQYPFRMQAIRRWLENHSYKFDAIAVIGGLLKPLESGTFHINEAMLSDARANIQGAHASNLGCAMAYELAKDHGCRAFVVDPVSVDEFSSLARYSGHPAIARSSLSHALNIHATVRRAAAELGKPTSETSLVVAHLGGGISIAPVKRGRIIDVNDASSDGPFSPERTGGLPLQQFIGLCYSGKYSESEIRSLVMGKGGLRAYLGTNSANDVEACIERGDTQAEEVFEAMAYQIAKEIGAMSTVLYGKLDAIVLTGGLASSSRLVNWIRDRVQFIARVMVYPGEDEMLALAQGVLRVLRGQEQAKEY